MDLSYLGENLPIYRTPWYQTWMGLGAHQCDTPHWILPPSSKSSCVQKNLQKIGRRFLLNAQENTKYSHKSARKWKALITLARPLPAQESLLPSQEDCAQMTRTLSWLQSLWVGKNSFNLAPSEKKCWPQLSKSRRGEGERKGTEGGERVYGIQTRVLPRLTLSGGRKRREE